MSGSARAQSVIQACQRDAGIAFPDMHGEGIFVPASLWSVGRSKSSGAGSHWRHVRNCIDCTSSEIVLSRARVAKLNRRSRGVFVSEMPIEEERRGGDRRRR